MTSDVKVRKPQNLIFRGLLEECVACWRVPKGLRDRIAAALSVKAGRRPIDREAIRSIAKKEPGLTCAEIATRAGCSTATVDRALHNRTVNRHRG
ncbi:MAG: hypothetical protein E6R03_13760 [Hyphomicrobiaceae bacterium]|nr:MAG: hypothetical protein E6R03_13760 [Hyphomicrobiaceae bacterium]